MPINFDTLKTSEDGLRKLFLEFFNHVLESQDYLLKKFASSKSLSTVAYNYIANRERIANQYEAKILDEACWIISKDQPRAAHLRYIIAMLRSIKDLERMGDFVERVSRILHQQKNIDDGIHREIVKLMEESQEFGNKIYKHLLSGSKNTREYYKNASESFLHFSSIYRSCFKKIGQKIFKAKKDVTSKIAIFTAIKHIERNADHAFNILENFVYITEPDFYFRKETRKK